MMTRLRSDVEGANAVEFALVLPVLVLLLFGTMYGGSLFNSQQTVTQAAREGARFAATLPITSFENQAAWFDAIELRALNVLNVDRPLTPGPVEVCVRFYPETGAPADNGSCSAFPAGAANDKQGARVEVGATREATLELGVAAIGPLTLNSSAVARYEPDDLGDD